ncbi:hypothetical protein STCU_05480 [Strigomonas culicis]|uniref:Uncharacterized protein n=1 Tax=Strigomonas culicis TaxID=28005 RepID=S9UG02_9TRYP|nr:hypothetical protein STCU_05480 [Strigomonas culicis]|eukprot:EPY27858.1 hypothetical protein STCU_05480 [Strigomonas culicis]
MAAQRNPKLVSIAEEHALFPVLQERLDEVHLEQLIDLVAVQDHTANPSIHFALDATRRGSLRWPPATEARYGAALKDRIRDRMAQVLVAAAEQQQRQRREDLAAEEPSAADDAPIYAPTAAAAGSTASPDAILLNASREVTPSAVLRAMCTMGLSAGRRKRDVAFFSLVGSYFLFYINQYKHPTELIGVLTALKRAKVLPSPKFLDAIGRRLPVVNKKHRLSPLWSYRAMVNLSYFKCNQMNTYRFLADNTCTQIEERLQEEAKQRPVERAPPDYETLFTDDRAFVAAKQQQLQRFTHLTSFDRLSMFTRWLHVLSLWGAPHQQYFRPFVQPLLVPCLPFLAPPSLTRLLRAMRNFRTSDRGNDEPLVGYLLALETHQRGDRLEPVHVVLLLRLLAQPDSALPANHKAFFGLCHRVLRQSATLCAASEPVAAAPHAGKHLRRGGLQQEVQVLRPREMCTVCNYVIALQERSDLPLEDTQPLLDLVEAFAGRLMHLLELKLVSLRYIDLFLDLTRAMQHPDERGVITQLGETRCAVERLEVGAAVPPLHGEEAYYAFYDVDVRDTFFKLLLLNEATTYHHYRPLPGPAQVDFRLALTARSVLDVLTAVDLYERAFPGTLKAAVKRLLTRSVLEKLLYKGEEVLETDGSSESHCDAAPPAAAGSEGRPELVLRPPLFIWLTKDDVKQLLALVECCPLERVRTSRDVWEFLRQKAERLQLVEEQRLAVAQLQRMAAA